MKLALVLLMIFIALPAMAQQLPDKPQPAREGDWYAPGESMGDIPDGFILNDRKNDGRIMWKVEKIDSCTWCGRPMLFKEAAFDKKSSALWLTRTAVLVADIELTHRAPCFQSTPTRTASCKEANPLLGQSRAQAYSVAVGFDVATWMGTAWLRSGNKKWRVGGYRNWWIIPVLGDAFSAVGIVNTLAHWNSY